MDMTYNGNRVFSLLSFTLEYFASKIKFKLVLILSFVDVLSSKITLCEIIKYAAD